MTIITLIPHSLQLLEIHDEVIDEIDLISQFISSTPTHVRNFKVVEFQFQWTNPKLISSYYVIVGEVQVICIFWDIVLHTCLDKGRD